MTPQNKKSLQYGLAAAGVIAGLYLLTKKPASVRGNGGTDPTGNGDITNPTGTVFNAKKIADSLYEAVISTGFASFVNPNEKETIFNILKNVSQVQFGKVMTAFGKRPYNTTWGNDYFSIFSSPDYLPLNTILKTELLSQDYEILRKKYPNYL